MLLADRPRAGSSWGVAGRRRPPAAGSRSAARTRAPTPGCSRRSLIVLIGGAASGPGRAAQPRARRAHRLEHAPDLAALPLATGRAWSASTSWSSSWPWPCSRRSSPTTRCSTPTRSRSATPFAHPPTLSYYHWFGTDQVGQSRARRSSSGAPASRSSSACSPTVISTVLGAGIGIAAGYYGGWHGEVLDAHHRRLPRDPLAAAGHGAGRRLGSELHDHHPHHRHHELAGHRPRGARRRAARARAAVHRARQGDRLEQPAHHARSTSCPTCSRSSSPTPSSWWPSPSSPRRRCRSSAWATRSTSAGAPCCTTPG